ncbi:MAG: hypothetical protein EBU90_20985 [Proteobacteria bacterium]|nr:hypothetical protein [Pseudomonadota bacterium]
MEKYLVILVVIALVYFLYKCWGEKEGFADENLPRLSFNGINAGKLILQDSVVDVKDRLHLTSPEHVFLLAKGGDVWVSKAWGGNGNLIVEGTIQGSGKYSIKVLQNIKSRNDILDQAAADFSKNDPDGTAKSYIYVGTGIINVLAAAYGMADGGAGKIVGRAEVVKMGNNLLLYISPTRTGRDNGGGSVNDFYYAPKDQDLNNWSVPNGNDGFRKNI